jgi:hypothetical protein
MSEPLSDLICNVNFEEFAERHYNNVCIDLDEFAEDLGRIKYIKRLFNKYQQTGELKERLIINHLIILYNVFDSKSLTKMLFFKFEGYHPCIKPFLALLQRLPDYIKPYTAKSPVLYTLPIESDPYIEEVLSKLIRHE